MTQPAIPPLQASVHSPDLERAVLGVLLDGRHRHLWATFQDVCGSAAVFFIRDHRVIALALVALFEANAARIDSQTVIAQLGRMPWAETWQALRALETGVAPKPLPEGTDLTESALAAIGAEAGGANRVMDVQASGGSVAGFAENCKLLAAYKAQRDLVAVLADASEAANAVNGQSRLGEIIDQAIHRMAALVMHRDGTATMSEAMRKAIARPPSTTTAAPRALPSWGIPALDRGLPLEHSQLILVAAQPGHGKSSLALQAAQATAELLGDAAVALVNLEMPAEQLGAILLGRALKASVRSIRNGTLAAEQAERATAVIEERAQADIRLRTTHKHMSIDDICGWIRQEKIRSAGRLSLVVVDYVQLIDGKQRQTEYDRVSEASRRLKRLALELKVCLIALSQMSREGTKADRDSRGGLKGNPEPRPQDLRGSGSLEQDADAVVFIWPPTEQESADLDVWLKVAKNRFGPKGRIQAVFERANGQVFRQVSAPASMSAPAETSRAHHHHPPRPDEDGWADRPMTGPA